MTQTTQPGPGPRILLAAGGTGGHITPAVALADVFASDIDFCSDVQPGDSFRAVVEKRYVEGKYVGTGRVLAARFVNQGEREDRTIFQTLDLAWEVLSLLPKEALTRLSEKDLDAHYQQAAAE